MSALIFAQFYCLKQREVKCFFNFHHFTRFLSNYLRFLKEMHVNHLSQGFMKTFLKLQNSLRHVLHVISQFLSTSQY